VKRSVSWCFSMRIIYTECVNTMQTTVDGARSHLGLSRGPFLRLVYGDGGRGVGREGLPI
jgi:hypothetical protein